jgi:hypothetical protein
MPSSVVRKFTYDPTSLTLRIYFVSGKVYDYKEVPEDVYLKMKNYKSKGQYLNFFVKPNYEFEEIILS